MHRPGHKSTDTRPRLKVNKSAIATADDDAWIQLLPHVSEEKMQQFPPDSPARKRVPWSPSKNNNKVQSLSSPSHKRPNKTRNKTLLPTAPFASAEGGPSQRQPPRRKKSSDRPHATQLESKKIGHRLLLTLMLNHCGALLALCVLLTTAAVHHSVVVMDLFSKVGEAVTHEAPHIVSSIHGTLQSSSGGGWQLPQLAIHHEEDTENVYASMVKDGISTKSGVVPAPDTLAVQHSNQEQRTADFAYAYVIGGCKPEDNSYVYYFYDILINTYLQQKEGSKADVIVFVQMSFQSAYDTLPDEDIRLFNTMNIKVEYIPKAEDESFYRIMLDKFLTLGLVQYKRVLFLDGDVLTRGSMDYLFDLSIQGKLQENVVFAGNTEPANGGTFMVAPKEDSWDRLLDIIRKKEERGAVLPYPHWNETIGWGHVIEEDDYWECIRRLKAQTWDFYGAFADQGLLYHWVKYEEKSVSIVFKKGVQHWGPGEDGKVHHFHSTGLNVFNQGSIKPVERQFCWMKHKPCQAPYSDFIHFTGRGKPWLQGPPEDFGVAPETKSPKHYWFYILDILNKKLEMNLDFDKWRKGHRPSLGMFPQHKHVAKTSYASSK